MRMPGAFSQPALQMLVQVTSTVCAAVRLPLNHAAGTRLLRLVALS